MTREEAIKILTRLLADTTYWEMPKQSEALKMAIAALREQEERRWIPVMERLPETEEFVLVIVNGKPHRNITLENACELANYIPGEGWVLEMWPEWESPDVTHWMPLPEPPKEDAK